MTDYSELEAKIEALKTARELELAITRCETGPPNDAVIYCMEAASDYRADPHGGHGAHRSVSIAFTLGESAALFRLAEEMLKKRLSETKAALGV